MAARQIFDGVWVGASTDKKPGFPTARSGNIFFERNTKRIFVLLQDWTQFAGGSGGTLDWTDITGDQSLVGVAGFDNNAGYLATVAIPGDITATGTPDSTTFLRGDGAWAEPAGGSGSFNILEFTKASLETSFLVFPGNARSEPVHILLNDETDTPTDILIGADHG